jgi:hypothetical protein
MLGEKIGEISGKVTMQRVLPNLGGAPKVDRLVLKPMVLRRRPVLHLQRALWQDKYRRQSRGSQSVEDNAFHLSAFQRSLVARSARD